MATCFGCFADLEAGATACPECGAGVEGAPPPSGAKPAAPRPAAVPGGQAQPPPAAPHGRPGRLGPRAVFTIAPELLKNPSAMDAAPEDLERPPGLAKAALDNPIAALVLVVALLAPILASQQDWRLPAKPPYESVTSGDADARGLLVRPAVVWPDMFSFGSETVTVREAWLGEIGDWHYAWLWGDEVTLRPAGRYRLYFSVEGRWPASRGFYREGSTTPLPARVSEASAPAATTFAIDVPHRFPKGVPIVLKQKGSAVTVHLIVH